MERSLDESRFWRGRRVWWAIGLLAFAVVAIVWRASDRVPSDATVPIHWRGSTSETPAKGTLRVGSFNIHGGGGPGDAPVNLERTAALLEPLNLDLIGLYEVHGGFDGDQAKELGGTLEMASVFAGTEYRFWHDHFGNAILAGVPVDSVIRIDLPCTQPKRYRNALLSIVKLDGVPVHVIAAHLDTRVDHDRQFALVADLFQALEAPAVLMGDLNCTASDPLLAELLADPEVVDAIAQGGASTANRIDHILVRGLEVESAEVIQNQASDHPLVWAEVSLPDEEGRGD